MHTPDLGPVNFVAHVRAYFILLCLALLREKEDTSTFVPTAEYKCKHTHVSMNKTRES